MTVSSTKDAIQRGMGLESSGSESYSSEEEEEEAGKGKRTWARKCSLKLRRLSLLVSF